MQRGIILIWHGAIVDIPSGFKLCDGNNGTPNLTDKFVIGAGNSYAPGATGGSFTHTHPFTGDGHDHTIPAGTVLAAAISRASVTSSKNVTGTTDNGDTIPPYYALAFIMKT